MSRKNVFVKISGDLCFSEEVLKWIGELAKECFVVVCVGGGTQINEEFEKRGWEVGEHGSLGREIRDFEKKQFARDILEKNQVRVQELLAGMDIRAEVIIPVLDIATVLCHLNGDTFVLAAYLGFDAIYVVTTKARVDAKREHFSEHPKIEVIGFAPCP